MKTCSPRVAVQILCVIGMLLCIVVAPAMAQVAMYSDTWNDDPDGGTDELPLWGLGASEEYTGGAAQYVHTTFFGDSGEVLDQSQSDSGYWYVQTFVYARHPWNDIVGPIANCAESVHFEVLIGGDNEIGTSYSSIAFKRFRSIFERDHYNALTEQTVYKRMSTYCVHVCQPSEYCVNGEVFSPYIYIYGYLVGGFCLAIPPFPRTSLVPLQCLIPGFGTILWQNTECR